MRVMNARVCAVLHVFRYCNFSLAEKKNEGGGTTFLARANMGRKQTRKGPFRMKMGDADQA